jgi:hypothetical protein
MIDKIPIFNKILISINFQQRFTRENKLHSLKENNHTVIIITTMASSHTYTLFAHEDPDAIKQTVKRIAERAPKLVVMQGTDACYPSGFRTNTANLIKTFFDIKTGGLYASIFTVLDDVTLRDFTAERCIIINACNKSIRDVSHNMVPFHTYLSGLKPDDVIIVRCVGDRSQMDDITFHNIMSATPSPVPSASSFTYRLNRDVRKYSLSSSF